MARKKIKRKIGNKLVKSDYEFQIWEQANSLKKKGMIVEYEVDKLKYSLDYNYNPDFTVTREDGTVLYIETKGSGRAWTPEVRRKMLAVKKLYPDLDIRFLFYRDAKFGAVRKDGTYQTQSEWAEKHGFIYAIGDLPEEWLK